MIVVLVRTLEKYSTAKIKQNKSDGNVHGLEFPLYPVGMT
jgi:hypothetical protein